MSSRPILTPHKLVVNGDMSASITSPATITQMLSMVNYSVSWVGTAPVGVITIQASNDYSQNQDGTVKNPGTWNTLALSVPCTVSGNVDNGMIDIDAIAGYALRLVYTRTSGTGSMQVVVVGKVA